MANEHITKELFNAQIEGLKTFIGEKFKNNDKGHDRIEAQTTRHNGRLRKLEMKYWIASGAIIVVGWLSGFAILEIKEWSEKVEENHDKLILIDSYFEKE